MYQLDDVESVTAGASMEEAIHRMIIGQHHSLLVTSDTDRSEMVGVLRLTDVLSSVGESVQWAFATDGWKDM
jgi:CBS domain-containing protein